VGLPLALLCLCLSVVQIFIVEPPFIPPWEEGRVLVSAEPLQAGARADDSPRNFVKGNTSNEKLCTELSRAAEPQTISSPPAAVNVPGWANVPGGANVTIVTAYYLFDGWKSPELYFEWMAYLFRVPNPIVFFGNRKMVHTASAMRGDLPIHAVHWEIAQFNVSKRVPDSGFWAAISETRATKPLLLQLWMEKYNMLRWASRENVFRTRFFSWLDVGSIREPNLVIRSFIGSHIPKDFMEDDQVILQVLAGRPRGFRGTSRGKMIGVPLTRQDNFILCAIGCLGTRNAIEVFYEAFYSMLDKLYCTYLQHRDGDPTRAHNSTICPHALDPKSLSASVYASADEQYLMEDLCWINRERHNKTGELCYLISGNGWADFPQLLAGTKQLTHYKLAGSDTGHSLVPAS